MGLATLLFKGRELRNPRAGMFKRILIANRGEIACRNHQIRPPDGIERFAVYSGPTATRFPSRWPIMPF